MATFQVVGGDIPQSPCAVPHPLVPPSGSADDENAASANEANLEHFIPLRKAELIERLCWQGKLAPADEDGFRRLCQLLDATLHFEYHAQLEDLQNAYAPFDCDSDTVSLTPLSAAQRQSRLDLLFGRFDWLLGRANFQHLSRGDLEAAMGAVGQHGLRFEVDLDGFDRLETYCRGEFKRTRLRRSWKNLFRREQIEEPVYQRLVIIFRLRDGHPKSRALDAQDVFIKLFKDV